MKKMVKIKASNLCNIALFSLLLPNILFAFGWLSGIWSILFITIMCVGMLYAVQIINRNVSDNINITLAGVILLVITALVIVWISGIGGYFPQCYDWYVRNPIYWDLILYDWPVVYAENGYGLCYYIGFWLVPASITKVFSLLGCGEQLLLLIGDFILYVWSVLCVSLFFILAVFVVYRRREIGSKKILLFLSVFISFGGLAVLGEKFAEISGIVSDSTWMDSLLIEHWSKNVIIMNNNITMLMNVFNQLIPAWIATLLFLVLNKKYELFGLIGFSLGISAPFPMVGLGIMMIGVLAWNIWQEKKLYIKRLFSLANISSLFMLIVSCLYFVGGDNSKGVTLRNIFAPIGEVHPIIWWLLVFLLTYGGWSVIIFIIKRTWTIFSIVIMISLLSVISIGGTVDFAMRATIPGYFVIMLYVLECLDEKNLAGIKGKAKNCLPIMLTISFMTIWICFMNLCEEAVGAQTVKKPRVEENYYSLEGNADTYDFNLLHQYLKRDLQTDLFFGVLCGIDSTSEYPVIQKVWDDSVQDVKIESVALDYSYRNQFLELVEEKDILYAAEQLDSQLQAGERGKVCFKSPLSINRTVELEDGDLDIEWVNYSKKIKINNVSNMAHVKITNNSDKVIPFSTYGTSDLGVGFFVTLTDEMGNEKLIAYRKINRFIFPGQSVSVAIAIPKMQEKNKSYDLKFSVYQTIEDKEGLKDIYYKTTTDRKYVVEYK